MRYLIRSVKYFVQLMVILVVVIAILIVAKVVDSDISKIFVNGYDSLWQIAILMAVFAAIYPRFGYVRREVTVPGSDDEAEPILHSVMDAHGYVEESADSSRSPGMTEKSFRSFRKKAAGDRLTRLWEDRITATRTAFGYELEGSGKDVARLCNAVRDKVDM